MASGEGSQTETEGDLTLETLGERLDALERSISGAVLPRPSSTPSTLQALSTTTVPSPGLPTTFTTHPTTGAVPRPVSSASTGEELIQNHQHVTCTCNPCVYVVPSYLALSKLHLRFASPLPPSLPASELHIGIWCFQSALLRSGMLI